MADEGPLEQHPDERTPLIRSLSNDRDRGILRRSWHSMAEMINPFSSGALSLLPKQPFKGKQSSVRTDAIPDPQSISEVRDYHSINATLPPGVRIPKKIATPINVEGKVWFANERTWVAYTNLGIVLGTLSLALFNASEDAVARNFGYVYAFISCGVIIYGYVIYQKRITMIRRRDPGHFDQIWGPVTIAAFLFVGLLANFIIRSREFTKARNSP